MQDVSVMIDNYKFNFRVCALIENNGRYLLEKSNNVDFLNMPGGRVHVGESTLDAIKREIKEEIGITVDNCRLIKVAEQFFNFDNKNYHELNFVYYVHLDDNNPLTKKKCIKNLDNKNETMNWYKKDELHNYKILPEFIYDIKADEYISHHIFSKLK